MAFLESELLPISGLQHLLFCERQCALIHVEQVWQENVLTVEGRLLHERVDSGEAETRGDRRVVRGVPLRSFRLGLAGRADALELHRVADGAQSGCALTGFSGRWQPFPVEYKRGEPKRIDSDRVQLCAQAICIEEMLAVEVSQGALFYNRLRRREEVAFDERLRGLTEDAAARFHRLVASGRTPVIARAPKCRSCSLLALCMPPSRRRKTVSRYLGQLLDDTP